MFRLLGINESSTLNFSPIPISESTYRFIQLKYFDRVSTFLLFQRRRLRVEQPFHVIRVRSIRSVERLTIAPSIKTKPNWGLFRVNMIAEHLKHHSFVRHSRPPIIFDDLKFWDICGLTFLEPYS